MFFYIIINVFIAKYDIISGLYSYITICIVYVCLLSHQPCCFFFWSLYFFPCWLEKNKTSVAHIFAHHATNFLPNYMFQDLYPGIAKGHYDHSHGKSTGYSRSMW